MKSLHQTSLLILSLLIAQNSRAALCAAAFSQQSDTNVISAQWRSTSTHPDASGNYVQTSKTREIEIDRVSQKMEDEILGVGAFASAHPDTPPIEFVSEDGTSETYASHSDGANHQFTVIHVSKVAPGANPSEGILRGTLLVPASGHTGAARARVYAVTDTYTVHVQSAVGITGRGNFGDGSNSPILIDNAKSLNLVTAHETNIPLVKGQVTRIFYFRSGSGGPYGYFDGRVIDFVWDGTTK